MAEYRVPHAPSSASCGAGEADVAHPGAAGGGGPGSVLPGGGGARVEHVFGADELFFSTTDAQGRIRRANSTFMRLSGYPRGSLVGRAHNIVRHADMPAGLFRSVWDSIENGYAACAYITNRSSDDGCYRVFATVVPSGDGYLSVRTLPMLTGLRDSMESAYARVRQVESDSAAAGSTRREVAAAGSAALRRELRALGYADAVSFTRRVLPEEVAALVASGVGVPDRPDATGPVARILSAMRAVEDATSGLVGVLEEGRRLVELLGHRASDIDALSERLRRLRQVLRDLAGGAGRAGSGPQGVPGPAGADLLRSRCLAADAQILECLEQLRPLHGQVEELRGDVDSVRFAIALMRLHNLAAGFFALQLLDGEDEVGANDAIGSLEELCTALRHGAGSLAERVGLLTARSELVAGELEAVAESLAATATPLEELLRLEEPARARAGRSSGGACGETGEDQEERGEGVDEAAGSPAGEAGRAVPQEPSQGPCRSVSRAGSQAAWALVREGFPEARDLADLAGSVRDLEVPYDAGRAEARLAEVRDALARLRA